MYYKLFNIKNYKIKFLILLIIILLIKLYRIFIEEYILEINNNYIKVQNELNLNFNNKIKYKIRIAIYAYTLKNGGRARVTSLLIKLFQ